MMYFNDVSIALVKEAQFTREMLGSGATQIRKANYAQKGIYFQAFTSLSTGIERIGKICLLLDYYIDNDGGFPDFNYLKKNIGHKILVIYRKSMEVINKRSFSLSYLCDLDCEIHQNILSVLSAFAEGDRYSNINLLLTGKQKGDPVASWFEKVDQKIYEQRVTTKRKNNIAHNAQVMQQILGGFSQVIHISETGSDITNVQDASFRSGVQKAVAPYRQLYVLQIIRFWVELVCELQYLAMELGREDIPFFNEVFAPFYNSDSYIRTRKTWDKT